MASPSLLIPAPLKLCTRKQNEHPCGSQRKQFRTPKRPKLTLFGTPEFPRVEYENTETTAGCGPCRTTRLRVSPWSIGHHWTSRTTPSWLPASAQIGSEDCCARSKYKPLPPCPCKVLPSTSASVSSEEWKRTKRSVPVQGSQRIVTHAASEKNDFVNAGFAALPKSVKTRTIAGEALVDAGQKAARAVAPGSEGEPGDTAICEILSIWIRLNCVSKRPSSTRTSLDTPRKASFSSVLQTTGGHLNGEMCGAKKRTAAKANAQPGPRRTRSLRR
mmetsp:Transcript_82088/g.206539  ORF Transcript_82088/g.206539 Transcript_82088/m.206539 type:complete len:274 (-) Transcript_82088:917-1738(-)